MAPLTFRTRPSQVISRYQNRLIETAQVMKELIAMAVSSVRRRGEQLRLTDEKRRSYDALTHNESAVRERSDKIFKKIADELTENLRKNLSVNGSQRESLRASLCLMIRRILRR